MSEGIYIWQLVIHANGARSGHVLFCKIRLKIFICTKALCMGLSLPHRWRTQNTSWGADYQQVAQANTGDDNQSCRILSVIFNQNIKLQILAVLIISHNWYWSLSPIHSRSPIINAYQSLTDFYHSWYRIFCPFIWGRPQSHPKMKNFSPTESPHGRNDQGGIWRKWRQGFSTSSGRYMQKL